MVSSFKTAGAPFNDPTASDVVLQSSDDVYFYMYRTVLCWASPEFKDFFDKQPDTYIVSVPDHSSILHKLLVLVDPRARAHASASASVDSLTLKEISQLFRMANAYKIEGLPHLIGPQLETYARSQPLKVYALSAGYYKTAAWAKRVTDLAARCGLAHDINSARPDMKELEHLSSSNLLRLIRYRDTCGRRARDMVQFLDLESTGVERAATGKDCRCSKEIVPRTRKGYAWWDAYKKRVGDELRIHPTVSVALHWSLTSPTLPPEALNCKCVDPTVMMKGLLAFNQYLAWEVDSLAKSVRNTSL